MPDEPFEQRFLSNWPVRDWQDVTVLAAVSGGADSVALLRCLCAAAAEGTDRLIVAHYNHRWRGVESNADAEFVQQLARTHNVPCVVGQIPSDALSPAGNTNEETARSLRYQFLTKTAHQLGARYVVTAHTADDQVETVLHRILRGTGLTGLAGIPRTRQLSPAVTAIRPLLPFRRSEILAYLSKIGQTFRDDTTNLDTSFTRNRIRHKLIPQLAEQYNPEVVSALMRLSGLAAETQQYLAQQVSVVTPECVLHRNVNEVIIDRGKLAAHAPTIVREFFVAVWSQQGWPRQAMGLVEWERLRELAARNVHKAIALPGDVYCENRGDRIALTVKK